MKWWMWLVIAGAVVWYMTEREKAAIKIAANQAGTGAVNALGKGTVKVIDEAAAAAGRWISSLFTGSKSTTNTSGSSGTSAAMSNDLLEPDWA